jgi:anti-sigma regulatory factor (Ser/Thr protein kinase)
MTEIYKSFMQVKNEIKRNMLSSFSKISDKQKDDIKNDLIINYDQKTEAVSFSITTKYFPKPVKLTFMQLVLDDLLKFIIKNKILIIDILIAVDEITANILEHSYRKRKRNLLICFEFIFSKNEIIINIKDFGPYGCLMDISKTGAYKSKESFMENFMKTKRGMGLYMIKKIMDNVKYESFPDKYNIITLIKKIDESSLMI